MSNRCNRDIIFLNITILLISMYNLYLKNINIELYIFIFI